MSIRFPYKNLCTAHILNKHFTCIQTHIKEFLVRIHSRYLHINTRLRESHNTCYLFPSQAPDITPLHQFVEQYAISGKKHSLFWVKMNFIFLTLCLLLSFYYDTGTYPRLLCKERKKIISSSVVEEPAQLNLIIVWRRKIFPMTTSSCVT